MNTKEAYFHSCVGDWAKADEECRRLYVLWHEACERQRRLAKLKNTAFDEWQASLDQQSNGK